MRIFSLCFLIWACGSPEKAPKNTSSDHEDLSKTQEVFEYSTESIHFVRPLHDTKTFSLKVKHKGGQKAFKLILEKTECEGFTIKDI